LQQSDDVLVVSLSSLPTHHELVADIMWDSEELLEEVVEVRRVRGDS
jgi:hypothetical protein